MASISAELRVGGHVFPLLRFTYGVHQSTDRRGRVITKVRFGLMQVLLNVPRIDFLKAWAADPHKRLAVDLVSLDATSAQALETLHMNGAYCVFYREEFNRGDVHTGSYVLQVNLSDPDGFTITAGGPAAYVAPAAREHGTPPVAAVLGAAAGAFAPTPSVPPHLPAPVPVPSPDHAQMHVTAAEWQAIIAGRWDRENNKKFFKKHRSTEFHVAGDPFTYRTDAKGKVVAVYDSQKSYNVTGSKKGLMGIPLTLNGEPTYAGTPHLMPVTGNQKNVVEIKMAGNRKSDFARANKKAGLSDLQKAQGLKPHEAPLGYTWHHRDDFKPNATPPPYGTCTMELVACKAHQDTFVHFGSCDQCNKHFNIPLYY